MIVKDNQPLLRQKIACFFASPSLFVTPDLPQPRWYEALSRNKGHGGLEERALLASGDLPVGYLDFPHVGQVFRLRRTRAGQAKPETVYGLTSLLPHQASAKRLLGLVRGHWHIENKSHFVRDVTFGEDHSQVRSGSLPQVLAALRNVCIGLMRLAGHKNVAAACRLHAAQPQLALQLLGIQRTE